MTRQSFAPGSFLGGLSEPARVRLLGAAGSRHYPRGATILAQEEATADVFLVTEGKAVATLYARDGKTVQYREIAPGDIFGELAALDGKPRSAFVVASRSTSASVLGAEAFARLLAAEPEIARMVMLFLVGQVRRLTERVFEYSTLLVRERLMSELCRRARAADPAAETVLLRPAPMHFDLAAQIGSHRELVTKELARLARRGLVAREGDALRVPSVSSLEAELARRLD
jgi:CRP/FNR family transcriptional regulator, cyclic AMP receptor protein